MKNYAHVYKNSKKVVNEAKAIDIDKEHRQILEAVKKEFGIVSFAGLNESEKNTYKSMILEYWSPKTGLTDAGIKFINESKMTLSEKSSDDVISAFVKREVKADATNYIYGILSGNTNGQSLANLKADILKATGKKSLSKECVAACKQEIAQILCKHLCSKIKF